MLILASIAIGIGGALIDLMIPSALPSVLSQALDEYSETLPESELLVIGIASIILLLVGIVSTIGLYFFRPWAPLLTVLVTVIAYPFTVLIGPTVISGWTMALMDLSTMLWGAVLALTYFSHIKNHFNYMKP
jgi:hypothetical protein